ncbi:hypothetical protein Herbaro_20170 [Herbaspirillum sp. WKF16]|uniref:hypothetical protein n=1 Tax=Herbaspirillum sp. WKF16 TaxID=3028312 RepID=UPI0023A9C88B|nr:hypothetical protein [Herbaspirillum sp. WKF16]WDZ95766.1 hypothetical protein Herbaro_20170 [Herbaspirillum sp. WKF16]
MEPIVLSDLKTLTEVEAGLRSIDESRGAPLQVQRDAVNKRSGALYDAARLQLFVTWARAAKEENIHFHPSNNMDALIEKLCDYAPGIAMLRMAGGVQVGEQIVGRREALRQAREKMQLTDDEDLPNIIKGRCIDMTCVSGMRLQYLAPLFSLRSPNASKDAAGMLGLFKRLFARIAQQDQELLPESFLQAISIFSSELFRNTQEHATSNHRYDEYIAHVEGFIASWGVMEERLFKSDFEGHQKLRNFWARESLVSREPGMSSVRCLQLSFFDSGPGFASRAAGKPTIELTRDEERRILIQCLQKNFTTKQQTGAGQGIPGVLSALRDIGGLIKIRSGRHSIFNCFGLGESNQLFEFDDWSEEELAEAAGAVVTIIIPLRVN